MMQKSSEDRIIVEHVYKTFNIYMDKANSLKEKMLFWKYYKNSKQPEKPKWGSGLHRYFNDEIAVEILKDIVNIKKNTEDEALAKEFLDYFCKTNEIDINKIKKTSGALTLI